MSLVRIACLIALTSAAASSSVADSRPVRMAAATAITGTWDSTYGEVRLTVRGDRVHGEYPCCGGGTLDGRIGDGVITFHWVEPRGAGEGAGIWRIQRDGTLAGSWGTGQSNSNGGEWNLWRPRQIAD